MAAIRTSPAASFPGQSPSVGANAPETGAANRTQVNMVRVGGVAGDSSPVSGIELLSQRDAALRSPRLASALGLSSGARVVTAGGSLNVSAGPAVQAAPPTAAMRSWVTSMMKEKLEPMEQALDAKLASLEQSLQQRTTSGHDGLSSPGKVVDAPDLMEKVQALQLRQLGAVEAMQLTADSLREELAKMADAFHRVDARMEELSAKLEVNDSKINALQDTTTSVFNLSSHSVDMQNHVEILEARIETVRIQSEEASRQSVTLPEGEVQARAVQAARVQKVETLFKEISGALSELQSQLKEHTDENRSELASERRARQGDVERLQEMLENSTSSTAASVARIAAATSLDTPWLPEVHALKVLCGLLEGAMQEESHSRVAEIRRLERMCAQSGSVVEDDRVASKKEIGEIIQARVTPLQDQLEQVLGDLDAMQSAADTTAEQQLECKQLVVELQARANLVESTQHPSSKEDESAVQLQLHRKALRAQDAQLEQIRTKCTQDVDSIRSQLQVLQSQSDLTGELRSGCVALQSDIEALRAQTQVSQKSQGEADASRRAQFAQLQTCVVSVRAQSDNVLQRHEELGALCRSRFGELDVLQRQSDELDASCRSRFEELQGRVDTSDTKAEAARVHHSGMEVSWSTNFGDLESRMNALLAQGTNFGDLESRVNAMDAQAEQVREQSSASNASCLLEMQNLQGTCQALRSESEDANAVHGKSVALWRSQLADLQARVEAVAHSTEATRGELLPRSKFEELQAQVETMRVRSEAAHAERHAQLQGEVESLAARQLESQANTSALRAQIEVARDRHSEMDAFRGKLSDALASIEKLQVISEALRDQNTQGRHQQRAENDNLEQRFLCMEQSLVDLSKCTPYESGPSTQYGDSRMDSVDSQSCAESAASGQTVSVSEAVQAHVAKLRADSHESRMVVNGLQARLSSIELICGALRTQLQETLSEDNARGSDDLLDRFDVLQSKLSALTAEHSITRSNVERTERLAKETSGACRQMLELMPDRRELCSFAEAEVLVLSKMGEVRDECHKRVTLLSETLTEKLSRSIPVQVASQTRAVINGELESFVLELGRHTERLETLERRGPGMDLQTFASQLNARLESIEPGCSDQNSVLLSEIGVLRSLHMLTSTHIEDVQERLRQLEVREVRGIRGGGLGQVLLDPASAEGQMFEASVQAALDNLRGCQDTQNLRIDDLSQLMVNTEHTHSQELHSVSDGIKDYIQSLIAGLGAERADTSSTRSTYLDQAGYSDEVASMASANSTAFLGSGQAGRNYATVIPLSPQVPLNRGIAVNAIGVLQASAGSGFSSAGGHARPPSANGSTISSTSGTSRTQSFNMAQRR